MNIKKIFKQKHQLWLMFLYGSLSFKDNELYSKIYDFSKIFYYHMVWISKEAKKFNIEIDYDRDVVDFTTPNNYELCFKLIDTIENIQTLYIDTKTALFERILKDEKFIISQLKRIIKYKKNKNIIAFNKNLTLKNKNISKEEMDSLITFLVEENYKEYELILIYTYMNFYNDNKNLTDIFNTLIEESHFHLKSFARLMSELGILTLPRVLMRSLYKFDDIKKFLINGIKEEEKAKEQCLELSTKINDKELSKFFDFINNQENYHIELMKEAVGISNLYQKNTFAHKTNIHCNCKNKSC